MIHNMRLMYAWLEKELQKLSGPYLIIAICSKLLAGAIVEPGPSFSSVVNAFTPLNGEY